MPLMTGCVVFTRDQYRCTGLFELFHLGYSAA